MKKTFFLIAIVSCFFALQTAKAQNPITTLEHAGVTTVFTGQNSLVDAYNASFNGDVLYLSTGFFTAPAAIAKGIKIIGAGHFPDSANVAKRTTITSSLNIKIGADSLKLEGLYLAGTIYVDQYNSNPGVNINNVKISRCRATDVSCNINYKNNWSFEECFIEGNFNFSNNGINLSIFHCLINGSVYNIINGASINGNNIFGYISNVSGSQIQNNIILGASPINNNTSNFFKNNLFVASTPNYSNNSFSNNYAGVAQANIFVNQTGTALDYTQNYHLKEPSKYLGTDGTQVGIYGGSTPFKEKGLTSNPVVSVKNVATQTDGNGNLQINFTVKAQDR